MPTLIHSRPWRLAALAILYSAQGLPFGLFNVAVPSWMASEGYSAGQIGAFIGVATLPWTLKLLAAPLMDRFTYPAMGYRRPWVLAAQTGVLGAFLLFTVIPEHLTALTVLACLTNAFAATQDVAVDGMAIDILPDGDRATANGFMFGGQYLGISIGASAGGYAMQFWGLTGVGLGSAALMAAVLAVPVYLRERPGEKRMPWSTGQATQRVQRTPNTRALLKQTLAALLAPVSVLLLLVQFGKRAAEGLVVALMPVHSVQSLAMDNLTYNNYTTAGGIAGAVVGVLISPWFDRVGVQRAFWGVICAYALVVISAPVTLPAWPMATIVSFWVAAHLAGICLIATMMRFCHPAVAATQFAVYMALSNLCYAGGAFAYSQLGGLLSATHALWLAGAALLAVLPLWYVVATRYFPAVGTTTPSSA